MNEYTVTDIVLTDSQLEAIKNIKATTRYEALEAVAQVLGIKVGRRNTWASTRMTLINEELQVSVDISYSKKLGIVKAIWYYPL